MRSTRALEFDDELHLFLRLSAALGTRRGETAALRWCDVDLDAGDVHVHRALTRSRRNPSRSSRRGTKTHANARLSIDEETVAVLRRFRAHAGRDRARVRRRSGRRLVRVLARARSNRPMAPRPLRQAVGAAAQEGRPRPRSDCTTGGISHGTELRVGRRADDRRARPTPPLEHPDDLDVRAQPPRPRPPGR